MEVVAVIGSRDWPEHDLDMIHGAIANLEGTLIVSGGARGVDRFVERHCRRIGHPFVRYPVEPHVARVQLDRELWVRLYHARNEALSIVGDRAVAFVTKETGGTWDCIRRFHAKGKDVEILVR